MAIVYFIGIILLQLLTVLWFSDTRFLRDLRIEMFEHMESLPIRYFDRTPHGDIMSFYK